MTPTQLSSRLAALQGSLRRLALGHVAVWTLGAMAAAFAIGTLSRLATGLPSYAVVWIIALIAGAATAAWRWQRVRPDRVQRLDAALWAERHEPRLQYALVALAESQTPDDADAVQRRLAVQASTTPWEQSVQSVLRERRGALMRTLAVAVAGVALAAYPYAPRALAARAPGAGRAPTAATESAPGRVPATATVVPPGYSGRASRDVAFGETVAALAGSIVRIEGHGASDLVALSVQESSDSGSAPARRVTLTRENDGWKGVVRVGSAPIALRLRDAIGERWVLVTPVADSIPVATLTLPDADTLVLDTTATLRVAGTVHDDIGLRDARIEYIISSGGGEQFTFRSGVLLERRSPGRDVPLSASLNFATLGIRSGDLLHVRITAHDGNTLAGPSLGASETRTIRIPRVDERDSVAVDQLPPTPVDKSVLSQRQLLMLTERLVARMPSIERSVMLAESQRLGADQARLRKQVSDIIFARLGDNPSGEHAHYAGDGHEHSAQDLATQNTPEAVLKAADAATGGANVLLDSHGDETPVVAVNRPLLEAYNAMWDATRALQGGTPREAIDPMRRAVAAIQRARAAERIYLRGTPPAAVIDLEKIRLTGTDSAHAEARRAVSALPSPERRLAERVLRAMTLIGGEGGAALDSLRLVRLDALSSSPALASALNDAIGALERGRDATAALLRVRRAALTPWRATSGAALWLGGVP